MFLGVFIVFFINIFAAESTDIAAVYKSSILFLKNAHSFHPIISNRTEDLFLELPRNFSYPVALAYDPGERNMFVSDLNDKETNIFKLDLNEEKISLSSVVSKSQRSTIETIVIDPVENELIWTDSFKHGIFSSKISQNTDWEVKLRIDTNMKKPRGLALDQCNRVLYWTERFQKQRTIEKYDLKTKEADILREAKGDVYFQGIHFNDETKELIWAETNGDEESKSSCRIMRQISGEFQVLLSLDNCYPFSIASDNDFIYWSDWSREGIMRLNRKSLNLVKLVHTPFTKTEQGGHNGAFGLMNLGTRYNCVDPELLSTTACSVQYLPQRQLVIILSITTIIFFCTTVILLIKHLYIVQCLKTKAHSEPSLHPSKKRKSKISKRHKTFGSPKKDDMGEGDLCPRSSSDSIKINIEDCCQMTLCDTPCYTSLKKEGKGYKKKPSLNEDKLNLLKHEIPSDSSIF